MAKKKTPPIEVRDSGIQGKGVYATKRIPKDTWIIEYQGERIPHEEADQRYDDDAMDRHHTFLFTVNEMWCLDAAHYGNDARFINHSCEPNCEAVLTEDESEIWICSIRTIEPGEELTYDYGYELDESPEDAKKKYPCRCGARTCRGTIIKL